jgi:hypothetical protein
LDAQYQKLLIDFETHCAIAEERWQTTFRDLKETREREQATITEIKQSIEKLNKLVWSVGGSTIFILASALLAGILK